MAIVVSIFQFFVLVAQGAPTINAQPQSQTVAPGTSATFNVAATGTGTLSYQWRKNGADIAGATGQSFVIASAQSTDAGVYSVRVSDSTGNTLSLDANLTVSSGGGSGPTINAQPQSQTVAPGTSATFNVAATGTGTLSYQWRKNGADIAGATGQSFVIASAQSTDAGVYSVRVSDSTGNTLSLDANLTVSSGGGSGSGVDLVFEGTVPVAVSPNPVALGGQVTVNFTVKNIGTAPAPASSARVEIRLATQTPLIVHSAAVPQLLVQATSLQVVELPISSSAAPGTYIVEVKLDENSSTGQGTAERANDVRTASLTVGSGGGGGNTPPTISGIGSQTTSSGTATAPLAFTVGDAETSPDSLTVMFHSSNQALVPDGNITLGGSGAGRTVAVTPASGQSGTATITLSVSDGFLSASTSFNLTVNAGGGGGTPPAFVIKWGSTGNTAGQFSFPQGVAVDATGNVYVADRDNNRIQKFSSSGTFLADLGTSGSGAGQFSGPRGVAVEASGDFYVADTGNQRIQKFSSSGTFLIEWGTSGSAAGQFSGPQGVVVDASGNVYVTDNGNNRVQKFNNTGTFITQWGSAGSGDGQLSFPVGVAVDSSGNVYVADTGNHRIQKFSSTGTFLTKWGSNGSGDGQFLSPRGVAVGASDSAYVVDSDNHRMQKFSSSGTFLTKWGSNGNGDGQFSSPRGVAVDSSDNIYVTDTGNNRVQKFGVGGGGGGGGNAAPLVTLGISTINYTVGSPSLVLAPNASASDSDSLNFDGGLFKVQITANGDADDRLVIRNVGTGAGEVNTTGTTVSIGSTVVGSVSGGTGAATALQVVLNTAADLSVVEKLLRHVSYNNVSAAPATAPRTITFSVSDGDGGQSTPVNMTVNIGAGGGGTTPSGPDLLVRTGSLTLSSATVNAGGNVTVNWSVKNQGSADSTASRTRVQLLDSANVALPGTAQFALLGAVTAGGETPQTLSLTVPTTVASGPYRVEVTVDEDNQAGQLSTSRINDIATIGLTVGTTTPSRRLFTAMLNGLNEVPSNSSQGMGAAKFVLDGLNLQYSVNYSRLSGFPTAAHLHGPAPAGVTAGVLVGLTLQANPGPEGFFTGNVDLTSSQVANLENGQVYINIHTASFPDGEIRGQLIFEINAAPEISLIQNQTVFVGQTVPTIVFHVGDFETASEDLVIEKSSSNSALLPASGIVVGGTGTDRTLTITPVAGQLGSSQIMITVRDAGNRTSTAQFEFNVVPGLHFFQADLNKNSEVPPTTSAGVGTGEFVRQGNTLRFMIGYESLTGPLTMAHIHGPALAGATADVLFSLLPVSGPNNPSNQDNFGHLVGTVNNLTEAQVTDLMAGKWYVNLHTAQFPNGEIRGQIVLRAAAPIQNFHPTIAPIPNQRFFLGSTTTPIISITVGDLETPAGQLVLTKHSDNQSLVPDSGISIGSGENQRVVMITPATGQTGVANITITVEDAAGQQASRTFTLRVSPALKFFKTQLAPITVTGGGATGGTTTGQINFGGGSGKFVLEGGILRFELFYSGLGSPLTGAEIRGPALTTGGQPVVVPLTAFGEFEHSGRLFGSVAYSSELAAQLDRSEQRIVLKTQNSATGEVDGLIVPETVLPFQDDYPVMTFIPNQRIFVSTPRTVNFAIGDLETGPGQLVLTKQSDNEVLVPKENIVFGTETGHNRSLTVTPATGQTGEAGIVIFVTDASGNTAGTSFTVRVTPAAKFFITTLAPASGVTSAGHGSGKFVVEGTTLRYELHFGGLNSQVTGAEIRGPALPSGPVVVNLPLSGEVLHSGRIFGSVPFSSELLAQMEQGAQKVVLKTVSFPAGEVEGTITVQTPLPTVDEPPLISFIPNQRTFVNTARAITFFIADLETAPAQLRLVELHSSDLALVPTNNIVFGTGTGHERTVTITPAAGATGQTTISILVEDSIGNLGGTSFVLRVSPVVKFFEANLTGGQEVPPTGSTGDGTGQFVLDGNTLRFDIHYGGVSGDLTQARLQGATELLSQPLVAQTSVFHNSGRLIGSVPLTASQVTELEGGRLYVNLHTQQFPNGEIRGLITALPNLPFEDDAPAVSFIPNQRTFVGQTHSVQFVVSDLETPPEQLIVRVHSDNHALVPETPTNLAISSGGHSRTLTINPLAGQTGEAFIQIEVQDASGNFAGQGFSLRVSPPLKFFNVTLLPVIPPVNTGGNTALTIPADVPSGQGSGKFVMDGNTLRYEITFSGMHGRLVAAEIRSSTGQLVVNLPILGQFSFSGRFFGSVAYPSEQFSQLESGSQKLVLKSEEFPDGELGGTVTQQALAPFEDDPPTISDIPDQRTFTGTPRTISFVIGDLETAPGQLVLEKQSDNTALVPPANIVFGTGTGNERTVTITPVAGQTGQAGISISVKDASDRVASTFFNLRVTPAAKFFQATLNGSQETPPVTTVAQGDGKFVLDGTLLRYDVQFHNLSSELTAAHIHGPAPAGTAASPLHTLPIDTGRSIGRLFGSVQLTTDQVTDLEQGLLYVNLHSGQFANGEIRGQILVLTPAPFEDDPPMISFILDQRTFVNTPRTTPFLIGDLETPAGDLVLVKHSSNPTLVPLSNITFGTGAGPHERTITITPATGGLGESFISIEVRDGNGLSAFASFAFRVTPPVRFFSATLNGTQAVPPNSSSATGTAKFVLDGTNVRFDVVFQGLASSLMSAQINGPATGGAPTTFIATLGTQTLLAKQGRMVGTFTLPTDRVADFTEGRTSLSLQTELLFQGEIRGPIVELATAPTSNEPPFISPLPNMTAASGVATVPFSFQIGDLVTPVSELQIFTHSSNPALVPMDRIVVQGSDHFRTVTVRSLDGQVGTANITLTASDRDGGFANSVFEVTVVNNTVITFASTGLEAAVRLQVAKPTGELRVLDLLGLQSLNASSRSITSLAGLEAASNLEHLDIGDNQISNLSPLTNLKRLRSLNIADNSVTSLSALSGLVDLVDLTASDNAITSVAGIAALTELESLNLGGNAITDVAPLSGLNRLTSLLLDRNTIAQAGPLLTLTALEVLDLSENAITSVPNLAALTHLKDLRLSNLGIVTLTPLSVLTQLEDLDLSHNQISSLGPLSSLTNLKRLKLDNNNLQIITPIVSLPALQQLDLRNNLLDLRFGTQVPDQIQTMQLRGVAVQTLPQRNGPPTANNDQFFTPEDTALVMSAPGVLSNDSDPDGNTLSAILNATVSNGTLLLNSNGSFTYTPNSNFSGSDSFTYRVSDGQFESPNVTVNINVTPVNDPPTISNIANQTTNEDTPTAAILFTVGDQETPAANLLVGSSSSNPALVSTPNISIAGAGADRTMTINPVSGQSGSAIITLTVGDGNGGTATANFTLTVNAVNDPPLLGQLTNQTVTEGNTLTFTPIASDADAPQGTLAFSLDPGAPAGATINPATGVFSWTPTEAQGPGSYPITVRVTDAGPPSLSATQSFTVLVNESNSPPVLATIPNQTVSEGSPLSVSPSATDADQPPNVLTFRLGPGAPLGMNIDPSTGAITWTPAEAQGPGVFPITVQVADSAAANFVSQTFQVTVNELNSPPTLAPIANQSIRAGTPVIGTAFATDLDLPSNILTFSLDPGAPVGATINPTTGALSWTPPLSPETTTNSFTVRVTDNATPSASDTETFTVIVTPSNRAPVFPTAPNQIVNEGSPLNFTLAATDLDQPASQLTYGLAGTAPVGLTINPATGALSWTPTEQQGPSTNVISVRVIDNGTPPLSAERNLVIVVNEVNQAPVLAPIANQNIRATDPLNVPISAFDADLPSNGLTFSLNAGAPAGAAINPTTGAFSWTPTPAQGGTTNVIGVTARDNGTPPLSDTKTFSVAVTPSNTAPVMSPIPNQAVSEGNLLTVTVIARDADVPVNKLIYSLAPGAPVGIAVNPDTGVLTWTPGEAQGPSTNIVRVRVTDDGVPPLGTEQPVVIAVNELNTPPNIGTPANQTVPEGQLLTFTVPASDPDVPANTIQFSLGANTPSGLLINPTTGVVTWTPGELQGPSTNNVTIIATDNGSPNLSTNRVVTIVVTESNAAPVLAAIPPQSVNEGSPLAFTAAAIDADLPGQVLTFSIVSGAPAGATLNPLTGVFNWTPTELQGPGTNTIRLRVADSAIPPLSAEQDVIVVVNEVNTRPNMAPIQDQRVNEGGSLTFAVSATDPDVPANAIQFSLGAGAPTGATLNPTTGVFNWTPSPAQTPSTNIINFIATDNGSPALSTNRTATVVVFADNRPPVLTAIPPQTIAEGSELTFTATATDPDLPPQSLTFSLGQAPAGATINPATGVFTWTPSEIQGPVTNVVAIRVTDSGALPQRSTNLVTIVVTEVNTAPVLRALSNQTIGAGDTITLQAVATDADVPLNVLTFSLLPGAPAGASINPTNGTFAWTPTPAQSASTNQVTIQVADNGSPALNATGTFTIVVRAGINLPPTITAISNQTTRENVPTSPIVFTIADPDTPIANLSLIASSSNTNLVPVSGISFGGSETNRTVTITPAPNQNGTATITITVLENTGGRAAASFELAVTPVAPNITRPPQNVELIVGNAANFSVTATGTQPLTYQWSFNGTPITGATNSAFAIPTAQETDEGTYTVEVKNSIGSVKSADARLTANVPLRITQQPISQSVLANSSVTFALTASGRAPLTYQWRFNGNVVPGATAPSLDLTNVDASRAGAYFAIVSNASGSVTSIVATLEVKVPVTITQQPQGQIVLQGTNVAFSVQATGTAPLAYQWQLNGVDLAGQTNTVLSVANVTPANSGDYTVVVSNPGGSTTSAKAILTVSIPPSISRQPQSQSVFSGANVTFNVTVSGSEPLSYVWRLNGTPITGATSPTLTLPNVQPANTGSYSVAVSNAAGSVISDAANLTVTGPASIGVQPQPQTVNIGESATFIVFASGTGPFTYQWRFNGVDIPGARQFQLTVPNVRPEDAGSYAVIVSNAAGPVTSDSAPLRVNIPVTITLQPQSQTVTNRSSVVFTVATVGTSPLTYQWRFNGANLPGQTSSVLALSNVSASNAGDYSVVVGNVAGNVTSANATLGVLVPPSIQTQPASQNVPVGVNVTFSVTASGDAPLIYQWQRNGVNIPGANSSTFTLSNVQAGDSGNYSVVVENAGGAATSDPASLTLILPPLSSGSSASSAPPPIETNEGSFDGGSNTGVGGPAPLSRKNIQPTAQERWFSWKASAGGIVTFTTAGSTFDTEMTIYTGTPPNLTEVGSDDDRGGFFNSEVRFNAVQGTTYLVKVKGFEGATGRIVVSFKLQNTTSQLPVITTTPASQTVAVGADVAFTVVAQGADLTYQWYKNDTAIPNQTSTRLDVRNVQEADAARYTVKITPALGGTSLTVESLPAILQIGEPNTAAVDKFKNSAKLDSTGPQLASMSLLPIKNAGGSLSRGYSGSQVFSTFGASKEAGEPNHDGVVGGASQWFTYQAPQSGTLRVSTEGSNFDTLLAIYTGPGTDFESLKVIASDNNSGKDGITSVASLSVTNGTVYYIAVDGVKGASGAVKLSYEFGLAPVITQQPARQDVVLGSSATLSVATLSGRTPNSPALTYQWTRDGIKLPSQTSSSLVLQNVQQSSVGDYAVIVSNLAGSATSTVARVTVIVPVAISGQPQNQAIKAGSRVVFSVVANGTPAILYQWRFNGVDVVGATNTTYIIDAVKQADAGGYSVLARNGGGSTPSQEAILAITQPPQITTQPADQIATVGNPAAFTVTAEGTPTLRYQWRFNGVNLTNATQSTLALNSVQAGNAGEYTVVVSNDVDSIVSVPARLSVTIPLTLPSLPKSQTVSVGSSAIFSVTANGTGPFEYQWKRNGLDIPGEKTANLVFGSVQATNAGLYSVLVTGPAGFLESPPATLAVNAKPVITSQPLSQIVIVGKDAGFGVGATGTPPFSYQWFHNSLPIIGATNSTFILTGVVLADAGNFNVSISNAGGTTLSESALLTVLEAISEVQFNNGVFQFRLTVPEGGRATVQFSTDLVSWTTLPNGSINTAGSVVVEDRDTASSPLKYYKVILE
jgi:VCBS repeat-containing protein